MAFERITITPGNSQEPVVALFNPEEYTIDTSANYSPVSVPGLPRPPLHYTGGGARTLKMELLIDTNAAHIAAELRGGDARRLTTKVAALAAQQPGTKAPSVLVVAWGSFSMNCVLESISERYTRFQANGVPVRAYLTVSFTEFTPLPEFREAGSPSKEVHSVQPGDSLWKIAQETLGDPAAWRDIAIANSIDDPFELPPGMGLEIPGL